MDTIPTVGIPTKKKGVSFPVLIAIFVILFVIIVLMYGARNNKQSDNTVQLTEEKTVVYKGDTALGAAGTKLPEGFPSDIPLEAANLKESYRVDYVERGVIQYSAVYESSKTLDEVRKIYVDYMTKAGYVLKSTEPTTTGNYFYGQIGDDDFTVALSFDSNTRKTTVNLAFLDRK
jgi:hypothetical protein